MGKNFWKIVNDVIKVSDVLIIVLDAMLVDETRNLELEEKIERAGKSIIFVINKSDLVDQKELERAKKELGNCVFMSAKKHEGTGILRSKILGFAKGKEVKVGVLGYPNTGKSSIINALSGSGKANVGHVPGFTKGMQLFRVSKTLMLVDTPGVIPFKEEDEAKHLLIGSMDPSKADDPDIAAASLLKSNFYKVEGWYDVSLEPNEDGEEILEKIALRLGCVKKKNLADLKKASVKILSDWQRGKII